jgi:hypothetical protein
MELKQVYTTPDGKQFDTKAEALTYLRQPKIKAALVPLAKGNEDLVAWLLENQETVEMAFESGTIRRVTKVEHNKLRKALEAIKEDNNPKAKFVTENIEAILDSFRWPSVKRMTDDEKATVARNTLVAASNNEQLADWVIANKDAILLAYEAGVEKRVINPKATEALAAYRAKMAAKKEAEAATKPAA